MESLALILASISIAMNIVLAIILFWLARQYTEKISLLSHVAGHYINALEQSETANKIKNTRTVHNRIATSNFLKRGAR